MASAIWWIFEGDSQRIWNSFEWSKFAVIPEYFSKWFGRVPRFSNINPLPLRGAQSVEWIFKTKLQILLTRSSEGERACIRDSEYIFPEIHQLGSSADSGYIDQI